MFGLLVLLLAFHNAYAAADGALECTPEHETLSLTSALLGETRTINVYLPPSYARDQVASVPTLYMLDGGVSEDFPHVASAIDRAISEGAMQPVVLVGIENTQRRRDMTGPTTVETDLEIAPTVGGSAAFRAFIKQELFPAIAARFGVKGKRGVIGESLAGLFVVETFVRDRAMFDTYIAISPSLWWNGGQLLAPLARSISEDKTDAVLYVTSADEENIAQHVRSIDADLTKQSPAHIAWTVEYYPTLLHATIYRALAPTVLRKHYPSTSHEGAE